MDLIRGSVGRGGRNRRRDVVMVQTALNRHIVPPNKLLKTDGIAGSNTIAAILDLQHQLGITICNGRVDASGKLAQELFLGPVSVPRSQGRAHVFERTYKRLTAVLGITSTFYKPQKHRVFHRIPPRPVHSSVARTAIAWGAKVSSEFKAKVIDICLELEMSPDYLMTCMAFETGETFRSDIKNQKSSATGLIQFLQSTARNLNTSVEELASMTPVKQLDYVRLYFSGYKGRLKSLEDVYMGILCPAAVGKAPDDVLYSINDKNPNNYKSNAAFDKYPKDGEITIRESSSVLRLKYNKGLQRGYYG